ncbi:uncharacterized protein [Spinacia oleracea]|uniref:DUF6598 domain-containing protein n=1 Tax=Spinacia oleracea TaxID=3562 RepID=A0ABM3QT87_SPIOL|nr:uncharacterized protein LOC130462420 [Spinacia oleracea]
MDEMMEVPKEDEMMEVPKEDEMMDVFLDETVSEADSKIEYFRQDAEVYKSIYCSIMKDEWASKHSVEVWCEPVVEVLSVSLCNNNKNSNITRSREIYGNIFVVDSMSNTTNTKCDIYERNDQDDEPEIIPFDGGTLSLTGPDDVMSMDKPFIGIDIFDRAVDETIINGFEPLVKTVDMAKQNHTFEQFNKRMVHGHYESGCSAEVEYLALTFGVFAPVEVRLIKQPVEEGKGNKRRIGEVKEEEELEVYGTISATYNLLCSESKVNRIMLFEIKEDSNEFDWVTLGCPLTLSRSVVAVPAYSSLTIQVELWDFATKKLIVRGSNKFETKNYRVKKTITGLSYLDAEVTIDWEKPFKLDDPVVKKSINWRIYSHFWGPHVVEVFSIFIGRETDKPLRLHGIVAFCGGNGDFKLFKRGKDDPFILDPGRNLLTLKGPNIILAGGDSFGISVDLEDVDGLVSIKGVVSSGYGVNHHQEGWFNRLLCSVIKGKHELSFAAVHYTVIAYAIKVTLKVHLFFKGGHEHSSNDISTIHGSLVALNDKYARRSSYEKLYYRNVIFERRKENPLVISCMEDFDMDMELSKKVFAVPHNSRLCIAVDLSCQCPSFTGFIKETAQFEVDSSVGNDVVIEGDSFGINISVKWSQA